MAFYQSVYFVLCSVLLAEVHGQVDKAKEFLQRYNKNNVLERQKKFQVKFEYHTNATKYNKELEKTVEENYEAKMKLYRQEASTIDLIGTDDATKRQYKFLLNTISPKNGSVYSDLLRIKSKMQEVFGKASIPNDRSKVKEKRVPATKKRLTYYDIRYIMSQSTDEEELLYVWEAYRDAIGPTVRSYYTEYVRLNNIGARENGYKDAGEYKKKLYEVDDLETDVEEFWNELKPFYEELHAYVRYRLKDHYPNLIDDGEPIPAHILRTVLADYFGDVYKMCEPYPGELSIDVSETIKKKMNVTDMFKTAEDFFVTIGWGRLPQSVWNNSMFERPKNIPVSCRASAWDLYGRINDEKDIRIAMCAGLNQKDFFVVHHEIGHLYYDMHYWNQPIEFREGANPAFHEAVGDTIALSVQTPQHLHKIGLLKNISSTKESEINFLFKSALETISFLPYAYILDKWMWNVYNGKIKPEEYNKAWWDMRVRYQGIKAPSTRQDDHLDIATKQHVIADIPYIRYFFGDILKFVFHAHACKASRFQGNLHECSIYNSTEAGKAFGDMLKLGRSKPSPEQLKQFTGSEKISAQPIMEYYAPLRKWLKRQQEEKKYTVGWKTGSPSDGKFNQPTLVMTAVVLFATLLLLPQTDML